MAHNISDSDSDATIDPTENGAYHVADMQDYDWESPAVSPKQWKRASVSPTKSGTRPQKSASDSRSNVHDISESEDSDSEKPPRSGNSKKFEVKDRTLATDDTLNNHTSPTSASKSNSSSQHGLERKDTEIIASGTVCDKLPMCRYGSKCYRKNPSHFKEFSHPFDLDDTMGRKRKSEAGTSSDGEKTSKKQRRASGDSGAPTDGADRVRRSAPLNFLLTTVHGIPKHYNDFCSIGIKDILHSSMGNLQKSVQFNYMFDIPWLLDKYPKEFRNKPVLLVHGFKGEQKAALDLEASAHAHMKLCQARLDMPYGTHHTKMMMLLYDSGMRIVIHTANLIESDWHQRTQGVWVSPVFPKLAHASSTAGDSATLFKHDLLEYLRAYRARPLEDWITTVTEHDMSQAKVHVIGSVPGRHTGNKKQSFGHLKLRKVLHDHGPETASVKNWPVVGQFSSIGTLGAAPETWLCGEWYTSLSTAHRGGTAFGGNTERLKLIFPSKDNVRQSLEGYPAGGSLPYSIHVAKKQTYLHSYFHRWAADVRGRSRASPHIKTYCRVAPDARRLAWFAVTSANLSKAAWGALEKKGSQLMIRSYEIGVLFLPKYFGKEVFGTTGSSAESRDKDALVFPQPYDLPPVPYTKSDKPWIWDIAHTDLPDSHGNAWCPPR